MSYILDALKKAESERNLGTVPTLHAQPVFNPSVSGSRAGWRRWRIPTAVIVLLAILLGLAWLELWPWQQTRNEITTAAAAPQQPVHNADPKQAAPTSGALPPAPAAASSDTSPPVAAVPQTADPLPAVTSPVKAKSPKPVKQKSETEPAKESGIATPSQARKKAAPTPPAATPEEVVPTLRELPESIQREIPQLSVGGYIYSKNPADRSILINQKLLREGDQVTPDLKLEKMTATGVILSYKGYRYRTLY
jgi:general secretion pathway protein B